jgi:hypothetical protein
MIRKSIRLAVAAATTAAVTLLGLTLPVTAQASAGGGLVVRTDRGLIQGKPAEGIDQWLGVPYAAPPGSPRGDRSCRSRPGRRWTPVTTTGCRC